MPSFLIAAVLGVEAIRRVGLRCTTEIFAGNIQHFKHATGFSGHVMDGIKKDAFVFISANGF